MTAKEIKALRKKLGLTQEALAAEVPVSLATVKRWEKGTYHPSRLAIPPLNRLEKGLT